MLSDEKRADLLAQTGPVLAVALFEATGQRWVFVPKAAAGAVANLVENA